MKAEEYEGENSWKKMSGNKSEKSGCSGEEEKLYSPPNSLSQKKNIDEDEEENENSTEDIVALKNRLN